MTVNHLHRPHWLQLKEQNTRRGERGRGEEKDEWMLVNYRRAWQLNRPICAALGPVGHHTGRHTHTHIRTDRLNPLRVVIKAFMGIVMKGWSRLYDVLFISSWAEFGVAGLLPLPSKWLISLVEESVHCHFWLLWSTGVFVDDGDSTCLPSLLK